MSIVDKFQLNELKEFANKNYIPIAKDDVLEIIYNYVLQHQPKNILEIGTAIGYTTIVLAKTCPNSNILTVELNKERYNMALNNLTNFGVKENVKVINDDAKNLIKSLVDKHQKFDFIFLDGPKGQYINYINPLLSILNDNGAILCDNINYRNLINEQGIIPKKIRTIGNNLKKFNEMILNNENLHVEILDVNDGVAKITKTKG